MPKRWSVPAVLQGRGDHSRVGMRHALAGLLKRAPTMDREQIILINISGRGDKDIFTVADAMGVKM